VVSLVCLQLALAGGRGHAAPVDDLQDAAPASAASAAGKGRSLLSSGGVDQVALTIGLMLGGIFALVGVRLLRGGLNLVRAPLAPEELAGHVLDL